MILWYGVGMLVLGLGIGFGVCIYLQRQAWRALAFQQQLLADAMNRLMTKTWAEYDAVTAAQGSPAVPEDPGEYHGMSDEEEARIEQERKQ